MQFAGRVNRVRLKCRFVATTETARIPEDITGRARRVPVGEISWRTTFRALRHRNYRLFFYGQLVSLVGTWLQQTAMSWFVYEITGSKFLLGADDDFFALGWLAGGPLPQTIHPDRDASGANVVRFRPRCRHAFGIRKRELHYRNRGAQRNRDGL